MARDRDGGLRRKRHGLVSPLCGAVLEPHVCRPQRPGAARAALQAARGAGVRVRGRPRVSVAAVPRAVAIWVALQFKKASKLAEDVASGAVQPKAMNLAQLAMAGKRPGMFLFIQELRRQEVGSGSLVLLMIMIARARI